MLGQQKKWSKSNEKTPPTIHWRERSSSNVVSTLWHSVYAPENVLSTTQQSGIWMPARANWIINHMVLSINHTSKHILGIVIARGEVKCNYQSLQRAYKCD